MVDRDDLNHLHHAKDRAIREAQKTLGRLLAQSGNLTAGQIEEVIVQAMPALISTYGDVAATAAAEWYEQVRAAQTPGEYNAVLASPIDDGVIRTAVQDAVAPLWSPETGRSDALSQVGQGLGQTVARLITGQVRTTIETNAIHDRRVKRFARVPRGKTCAFCSMLASRGFVYASARSAGELKRYHDKCDCMVVPAFGDKNPQIKGYDPDALRADYQAARDMVVRAGMRPTDSEIARTMRQLGGAKYTDGAGVRRNTTKPKPVKPSRRNVSKDGTLQRAKVEQWAKQSRDEARARKITFDDSRRPRPERVINPPEDWPDDLPPLRAKEWYHTLYGNDHKGGHLHGYGWMHDKSDGEPDDIYEFPPDWGPQDIAAAGIAVLRSYGDRLPATRRIPGTYRGLPVIVCLNKESGDRRATSIYPDIN